MSPFFIELSTPLRACSGPLRSDPAHRAERAERFTPPAAIAAADRPRDADQTQLLLQRLATKTSKQGGVISILFHSSFFPDSTPKWTNVKGSGNGDIKIKIMDFGLFLTCFLSSSWMK